MAGRVGSLGRMLRAFGHVNNHHCYGSRRCFSTNPESFYFNVLHNFLPQAISATCELKLANHVSSGPTPVSAIASAAGTDPPRTERLLRYLAVHGIFDRVAPNQYRHNALSEVLRTDHPRSVCNVAMLTKTVDRKAVEELSAAVSGKSSTGFNKAFGTDLSLWNFLCQGENVALKSYFDGTMVTDTNISSEVILREYPWEEHQSAKVVDVGGGLGRLLSSILQHNRDFTGVVFDLPETIRSAREHWSAQYQSLQTRVEFAEGSFFEKVPTGGDVYVLKHIVHDWNDNECQVILKNVAEAMRHTIAQGSSRRPCVLLLDKIYDFPPTDLHAADMGLIMMTLLSGRERSLEEFKALLSSAGLRCTLAKDFAGPISVVRGELNT